MEFANFEMQEKLTQLQTENEKLVSHQRQNDDQKMTDNSKVLSQAYVTPNAGKQQNKNILEMDGIKCFDLDQNSVSCDDLRLSIGSDLVGGINGENGPHNINESLQLW